MTYDPKTDIFTDEDIALCQRLGLNRDTIDWLFAEPRTAEDIVREDILLVIWLFKRAADRQPPERLDYFADRAPNYALLYIADRLTPERLDYCAARHPALALEYAADRLSLKRLAYCAVCEPKAALKYAAERLTPEQLAWCQRQP